jgi:ribose 5-phosphate isomerase A
MTITGVPTSERTAALCAELGVGLSTLEDTPELDLTIDGADEVGPGLDLIKGGGGALLREKIVISAARRFVVVAEASKQVEWLGERFRLPVEVARFAWKDTRRRLDPLLPNAELRLSGAGSEPYLTDEGHYILDAPIPADADPASLAPALKAIPGVMEHGLFLDMADLALLGNEEGSVQRVSRDNDPA